MADELYQDPFQAKRAPSPWQPKFLPDDSADQRSEWYNPAVFANWAPGDIPPNTYESFFLLVAHKFLSSIDARCLKPGMPGERNVAVAKAMRSAAHDALVSMMTDEAKAKEQEARFSAIWDQVLGIGPRPTIAEQALEAPPDGPNPETWRDRPPLL